MAKDVFSWPAGNKVALKDAVNIMRWPTGSRSAIASDIDGMLWPTGLRTRISESDRLESLSGLTFHKLNPTAKISFPGFQEILDFTSAGSESSVSVTVDGDTDKEYKIIIRNLDTADSVNMLVGGDTTTYGYQRITNSAGTIAAARDTSEATIIMCPALSLCEALLLTPSGFIKTMFLNQSTYTSGTTMANFNLYGYSYADTATFTSLDFSSSSGNFTSGTRIVVYSRRSNV